MKVIDIVGQQVYINNEEDRLLRYIITRQSPMFHKLNDRFKEVAKNLYLKDAIKISDDGEMTVNFSPDLHDMI